MTEPLKRRSLLQDLDTPTLPPPATAIAATAARHGFASPPAPESSVSTTEFRRQRPPTGRVHQFNVRLRKDTLEAIYAQANGRNIPIAQVIEEAMQALDGSWER